LLSPPLLTRILKFLPLKKEAPRHDHPAEEEIGGETFDLVAHLVHGDADGHLAVVAVLFKKGAAHPLLDTLWKNLPAEKEKTVTVSSVSVNAKDLRPAETGYYTYQGSLTAPPCSEGVTGTC